MEKKFLASLLVAFAVFSVGAKDLGHNPWPSTVQGSMIIDRPGIFTSGSEGGDPTFEQACTGTAGTGTSITVTCSSAPSDGNWLYLCASTPASRTVTSTGFSAITTATYSNSELSVLKKQASSEGTTFTVDVDGAAAYHAAIILEISGTDGTLDQSDTDTNTATTPTVTPTVIPTLPIACAAENTPGAHTAASGWTGFSAASTYHEALAVYRDTQTSDTSTGVSHAWGGSFDQTAVWIGLVK